MAKNRQTCLKWRQNQTFENYLRILGYKEEGGYDLLKTAEEIPVVGDGINKSDLFLKFGPVYVSFLYKEETPTFVSGSHKAGYKADGSTVNEDGYMITVLMTPLG